MNLAKRRIRLSADSFQDNNSMIPKQVWNDGFRDKFILSLFPAPVGVFIIHIAF